MKRTIFITISLIACAAVLVGISITVEAMPETGYIMVAQCRENRADLCKIFSYDISTKKFTPVKLETLGIKKRFCSARPDFSRKNGKVILEVVYENDPVDYYGKAEGVSYENSRLREDVYTISADGKTVERKTTDGDTYCPRWSPDGKYYSFIHNKIPMLGTKMNLPEYEPYIHDTDFPEWSHGGSMLAFTTILEGKTLYTMSTGQMITDEVYSFGGMIWDNVDILDLKWAYDDKSILAVVEKRFKDEDSELASISDSDYLNYLKEARAFVKKRALYRFALDDNLKDVLRERVGWFTRISPRGRYVASYLEPDRMRDKETSDKGIQIYDVMKEQEWVVNNTEGMMPVEWSDDDRVLIAYRKPEVFLIDVEKKNQKLLFRSEDDHRLLWAVPCF